MPLPHLCRTHSPKHADREIQKKVLRYLRKTVNEDVLEQPRFDAAQVEELAAPDTQVWATIFTIGAAPPKKHGLGTVLHKIGALQHISSVLYTETSRQAGAAEKSSCMTTFGLSIRPGVRLDLHECLRRAGIRGEMTRRCAWDMCSPDVSIGKHARFFTDPGTIKLISTFRVGEKEKKNIAQLLREPCPWVSQEGAPRASTHDALELAPYRKEAGGAADARQE